MYHCDKEVAVLLAAYNGEKYLCELLDSLLEQTFKNFCIFVHDDGSTDHTRAIIEEYKNSYPDKFAIIEGEPTGSPKGNFLYLLKQVDAEYYMFCDQDDVWLPEKIQISMEALRKNEKESRNLSVLVYTDLQYVDENKKTIAVSYFDYMRKNYKQNKLTDVLKKNLFVGCTLLLNRQLRDHAVIYEDINKIYMHDWWVGLLATVLGKVIYVDRRTILYRQHSDNATGMKTDSKVVSLFKRWINIKTGVQEKKKYMNQRIWFAQELIRHIDAQNAYFDFVCTLSDLNNRNKLGRIQFYIKGNMLESGKNIVWQMLWI